MLAAPREREDRCTMSGSESQNQSDVNAIDAPQQRQRLWPQGWWRVMEIRIGIIPLPVYLIALGVIGYFVVWGKLPTEINVAVAVLAVGGFT